jgi:hypothetical protein
MQQGERGHENTKKGGMKIKKEERKHDDHTV